MDDHKPYPVNNYEPYRPARNPYAVKYQTLAQDRSPTAFTCHDTEKWRGEWRKFFSAGPESRLHLEIGCYHGETLIEMAEKSPDDFFIGLEWSFREAYKAAEKAIRRNLRNVCVLRANAARLPWVFAPGEVDRILIAFPDPWPKTTQQKWRVLHADFFRSLGLLLHPNKELLIKTDDSDYAAFIKNELAESQAFVPLEEARAIALWAEIPPTPFEKIFFRNNSPIFSFSIARNSNSIIPPLPVQHIFH